LRTCRLGEQIFQLLIAGLCKAKLAIARLCLWKVGKCGCPEDEPEE